MELCGQFSKISRWKCFPLGRDCAVQILSKPASNSELKISNTRQRRNSVACRPATCHSPISRLSCRDDEKIVKKRREKSFRSRKQICTTSALISDEISTSGREDHDRVVERFYEENEFVFEEEAWNGVGEKWDEKCRFCLEAGKVRGGALQVLVGGGSAAFVEKLRREESPVMLVVAHFSLSVLGEVKEMDDDAVCWHGDVVDLPDSYGPFDSVFLNSLLPIAYSPAHLLQVVAGLCKPGGRIVIWHCQGRENLAACRDRNPQVVLHELPDATGLETMINALPLKLIACQDDSDFYLATLEVKKSSGYVDGDLDSGEEPGDNSMRFPLQAGGHIVQGFGRGSKQMGIPTANIDPLELPEEILGLPKGVYFGWAQVKAAGLDNGVHKMVMNIGNRPTFADGEGVTVEVHILNFYSGDFYGEAVRVVILGFIRSEMRFNSIDDLVQRINTDISIAEEALDQDELFEFASDAFFVHS